jgi:flagellar biosynthesis/type III secretory pathway M-ring protein FliF/YscJ
MQEGTQEVVIVILAIIVLAFTVHYVISQFNKRFDKQSKELTEAEKAKLEKENHDLKNDVQKLEIEKTMLFAIDSKIEKSEENFNRKLDELKQTLLTEINKKRTNG